MNYRKGQANEEINRAAAAEG